MIQKSFFENEININGLQLIENFITNEESNLLIKEIDKLPWLNDLKRRVQHYGYKYDYKNKKITKDLYLGPFPNFINNLANKIQNKKIFEKFPDQAIVNEYLQKQGISNHIDCVSCFGNTIVSLSLNSDCEMEFSYIKNNITNNIILQPNSLLILENEARYNWTHCIKPRKNKNRRVSITFRTVLLCK